MTSLFESLFFLCRLSKIFQLSSYEALFQRIRGIGISKTLLTTIILLYKSVLGHPALHMGCITLLGVPLGSNQGFPLSPTLFGIYIDELESFLHDHIQDGDGCHLH
jgi:hypothetical protein